MNAKRKWIVIQTSRPDAGGTLYNIGQLIGNNVIESEETPTHSRQIAEQRAAQLNETIDDAAVHQNLTTIAPAASATPGPWFWQGAQLRTRAAMGRDPASGGWIVPIGEQDAHSASRHGSAAANRALIENAPQMHRMLVDLREFIDPRDRSLVLELLDKMNVKS
jgi:hypothetical protein